MSKQWSEHQNRIFEFLLNSNESLAINAVAGSGKTTTIVEGALRMKQANPNLRIAFMAFNNTIVDELSLRFKGTDIMASTLHRYGNRQLHKIAPKAYIPRDNRDKGMKYLHIANHMLDMYAKKPKMVAFYSTIDFANKQSRSAFLSIALDIFDKCRVNLIQPNDIEGIKAIADHYGLCRNDELVTFVNEMLPKGYEIKSRAFEIDFTDMLVLCQNQAVRNAADKFDVVFVDECQDLSKAQRSVLMMAIAEGGRFIAVGDRKQAINGFAGAGCDSFDLLAEMAKNELPLSVCYRCGKSIIAEAQKIVPYITAFEGNCDGSVIHTDSLMDVKEGDFILCRTTAPLISVALKLIANGNSAAVVGKNIISGLKSLVERMDAISIDDLLNNKLKNEKQMLISKLQKQGIKSDLRDHPSVIALNDKVDCIEVISENCETIAELMATLDKLGKDTKNGNTIKLSTAHKSKGLEADNVFILLPDKLPMKRKNQLDWEWEQELNLKYVAVTRAKKALYFVDVADDMLDSIEVPHRR